VKAIVQDQYGSADVLKELIEAGKVTPVVDRSFPLAEAAAAVRHLEQGLARGKVVLRM
jgi:NADPH:quinone reductase-like Zn-dependent oxidoreductase